ncbi:MAG: efflux RND transporter periplasmic adaptor subunit [Bernardetiaceae bacterium]|nr:efflux RND transporter periplasmic adaptor subunit [Bernardetiaceae bacterium]
MKNISYLSVFAFFLFGCSSSEEKTTEPGAVEVKNVDFVELTDAQLNAMEVKFIKPERRQVATSLYLNGKVSSLPNYQATVSANIQGKIERIMVHEGSLVRRGQTLMTMSSMALVELQNEFLAAKSERDFLEVEFKRQEELIKNNVGALADFQLTEAKLNAALSREKAIQAKLELLRIDAAGLKNPRNSQIITQISIISPIDGYVTRLPATIGMLANIETTLAEVVNVSELHAEVAVFDKELDLIREGQPVELEFTNRAFPRVQGRVAHISREISQDTKAVMVHVNFTPPPGALVMPGMAVRAVLASQDNDATAQTVPLSSLVQEDDQFYVFATDQTKGPNGRIRIRKYKVTLGDRNETTTEVIFPNGDPGPLLVAQTNVSVLETQRRQASGQSTE